MKRISKQTWVPAVGLAVIMLAVGTIRTISQPARPLLAGPPAQFSTQGGDIRMAVMHVHRQVIVARREASNLQRRAGTASYQWQAHDLQQLQASLQELRARFGALAARAQGQPLAGYRSISELLADVDTMNAAAASMPARSANAGDRRLVQQTCRQLDDALGSWDSQVRQATSRLNFVR